MYDSRIHETIKIVNGLRIYRLKGTHGSYWIDSKKYKNIQYHFKTQKEAVALAEKGEPAKRTMVQGGRRKFIK